LNVPLRCLHKAWDLSSWNWEKVKRWFCWWLDIVEDHCERVPKACVLDSQESRVNLTSEAYLHFIWI